MYHAIRVRVRFGVRIRVRVRVGVRIRVRGRGRVCVTITVRVRVRVTVRVRVRVTVRVTVTVMVTVRVTVWHVMLDDLQMWLLSDKFKLPYIQIWSEYDYSKCRRIGNLGKEGAAFKTNHKLVVMHGG